MYLSIGGDMAVRDRAVIGIFDLDNTTYSKRTRELLRRAEELGGVVDVSGEEKKKLTVPDLLAMFSRASGSDEANDKMLLS